jgi:hypothetical protein
MTEPTLPDDRPFGPETDEAVSAHLDGELAGFAAAHGLDEDEARQRLEAWPGLAARAAALARTRTEVAPVAPLDEVARRRLVQGALREAAPGGGNTAGPRWGRALGWAAGAAAAVALVVGIGVVVTRDPGGDASSQAGSGAGGSNETAAAVAPEGALGDIGDVTDPERLEALFGETDGADEAAGGDAPTRAPATSDATADQSEAADDAANARRADAFDACAAQVAGGAPIRFTATGTFQGAPVVVVGISRDGRTIVFVVPPDDCTRVLSSVSR